ncbi:MAG: DsbA family protein [Rhodospirillaceae bacterium]|jgi:protein-disulfide isomerase|nr:DsbA family protein [Rhodospirillaceae bacterium]MBT3491894.1 DsbA family protein [Rhodospirillaceae bacterium]MBT3780644.1 DsbA family protein [Rhodospirillaceae bacterium]MBT3978046.1 DsbA family protein [Rhodospirillaceae bacterium]MBT4170219.1 DsbA family protein [Rhodospirillaceae bacterium]
MTVSVFRRIGLFVVFALMPLMMASGGEAQQSTDPETVRIEKIIRNYLLEHPELLVEVMRKLEARQKAEEEAGMAGKIQANRDALFASHDDFIANPMGKFPVVEFFDYQCGYCKRFLPTMARLLETDKSVRFVFKEFPILGEVSVTASKAALAAKMQGKYRIFHDTVMGLRRRLTEAAIYQTAKDIGLDVKRLKRDMESPKIARIIKANRELAATMGIRGTPSLIVGEQLVPGAIDYGQLTALIEQEKTNCKVC